MSPYSPELRYGHGKAAYYTCCLDQVRVYQMGYVFAFGLLYTPAAPLGYLGLVAMSARIANRCADVTLAPQ